MSFYEHENRGAHLQQGPSPIDPVDAVRSHPSWFFRSGRFEPETAIQLLMTEASLSPLVRRAQFEREGEWIALSADGDWLEGDLEAFTKPTVFREGGVNATRMEVLLTAFCDAVLTAVNGKRSDVRTVRIHDIPLSMAGFLENESIGRAIVFRTPPHTDQVSSAAQAQPTNWIETLLTRFPERQRQFENA
jgi:hypothetical protein